jgi:glycosyltransferase involved in cell wall biosynthesis
MKRLFVSIDFPYPPLKADSVFVYNIIKEMADPGSVITLSFERNYNEARLDRVKNYSSEVVCIRGIRPLSPPRTAKALASKKPVSLHKYDFDKLEFALRDICLKHTVDCIIFVDGNLIEMGYKLRDLKIPKIFHTIDSTGNNLKLKAMVEKNPIRKFYHLNQAKKWRQNYRKYLPYFDKTLTVTDEEKEDFKTFLDRGLVKNIEVLPYGVDTDFFKRDAQSNTESPVLIFHGSMTVDAETAVAELVTVYNHIKKTYPDLKMYLVGKKPTARIKRLVRDRKGIILTGYVNDIRPYLEKATVGVYPMRIGTGIKDRVLEAMAMELPVVTTVRGAYGIEIENNKNGIIAGKTTSFVDIILDLLSNRTLRKKMGQEARKTILADYTWQKVLAIFNEIIK